MSKSNRFRLSSFQIFDLLFNQRNINELICLFTVVLLLTCTCLADDGYEMDDFLKREYSLTKPYQGLGSSSSSHWDLMGNAIITTEHVRLTPDLQSRQGAVWSRVPCYLRDWELQVHFKIHGQGKKNLNGDGMALWYTKERMQTGTELALSITQTRVSQKVPCPLYRHYLGLWSKVVPYIGNIGCHLGCTSRYKD
ncbi:unnamed protein product [Coregonus sp. 'balchen']|nr:unnamed protein product [Coregonus sp. 'balchen']